MREQGSQLRGPLAHHDGSALYVSNPQPNLGESVELSLRACRNLHVDEVYLRVVVDGEPHYTQARLRSQDPQEQWWTATVEIVNHITSYRFRLDTAAGSLWLNAGGLHRHDIPDAQDFRLTTYQLPTWTNSAVIYQIFPDRFARSPRQRNETYPDWALPAQWSDPVAANTPEGVRQIYGGSLYGIEEHLDYIQQLGANTIYLTPFFPARSNHRYDASTFAHVDPLLGGDQALRSLTNAAHLRSMHVLGDLTLNHSGVTHEWFAKGQADPDSPEAGFYYFDRQAGTYATFDGVESLPKFDHRSAELRRRLYDGPQSVVARYIRDFGLDGWRIDVAQSAGKYRGVDLSDLVAERTHATMSATRSNLLLLAEHQFDASPTLQGPGWQGAMAYAAFTKPVWAWLGACLRENAWGAPGPAERFGGNDMADIMQEYASLVPWQSFAASMTLLDSHDTARFRSVAGPYQSLGVALLMTLPGIPSVFSGDEVGIGGSGLEEGRQPFPWNENSWDRPLYQLYRSLIALRHEHPCLSQGGLRWLNCGQEFVTFERADAHETLLVQVNRGEHSPVISTVNAANLLGGPDLTAGQTMPTQAPSFHIWRINKQE
ncbi:alpha-glycosidase [Bombiscardovia nodaiensis]|uniref:Alpha-glycosidase n=1 Tax=Bombiscardovia nodaiensis TaxID=2932181 RepID=A0ABM8B5Z5_9BIFI|nr:alpha-glycosidase [Bombiscardovia nodaiensis]